ncbi:MAG: helix-turn-helix transcriptional regulator [Magnetococcales bacterium]|nr:helix-turn-helix transcriptional regulator [Magnetococcales bacterium]
MKAGIKQVELARRMNVSQAYISKLEHSDTVSEQIMKRIQGVLQTKT